MFLVTLYRHIKDKHGQKTSFVILLAFLLSFIVARVYSLFTIVDFFPVLTVKGTRVHHLNFGISLLAVSGFLAFYLANTKFHKKIVILYGIGLGLTFDEFAMWLRLEDDYWVRASYDAVIIISVILLNAVFFGNFWIRFFKKLSYSLNPLRRFVFAFGARIKKKTVLFFKFCYNNGKLIICVSFIVLFMAVFLGRFLP